MNLPNDIHRCPGVGSDTDGWRQHDGQHPYVRKLIGCGHGVLFTDYCKDCEIVALQEQYRSAVRTVQRVRDRMRVIGQPMPGNTSTGHIAGKGGEE